MQQPTKFDFGVLSPELIHFYDENGFVYINNFYDLNNEVNPIKKDIYDLIGIVAPENKFDLCRSGFTPQEFDAGLPVLLKQSRTLVGTIYNIIKAIPSYVRLACSEKHEIYSKGLLDTNRVGFASRGYGIRMDNPGEDQYSTQLHQDYVSQLCSQRGVVFWSPLRDTTVELGPVRLYPGSHREGVFPIVKTREGSRGLLVDNAQKLASRFPSIAPEVLVGDCVIMDYMLLHESSQNRSERTRWSMISRYFDFNHDSGRRIQWRGGLQEGNSFESVHPELIRLATDKLS